MQEESQYISFSVLQEAIRQARYNALKVANTELFLKDTKGYNPFLNYAG